MPIEPSERAREAAASLLGGNRVRGWPLEQVRAGKWDDLNVVQAFARFEAEIRKDERYRLSIRAAIRLRPDVSDLAGMVKARKDEREKRARECGAAN